ncbi:MAG: helix-turn-helix domain-containing protein [Bacilli bacterium]|nr:helix-turn-helix domain-containing protein [Bacilli bacterium]
MTIKEIRLKTGLTQKQFSEKYHIPIRSIQNWETGVRKCPKYVITMLNMIVDLNLELTECE